eukprot:COSAG01_NODE_68978_length_262_cov_1.773006_1_plen_86_part_11
MMKIGTTVVASTQHFVMLNHDPGHPANSTPLEQQLAVIVAVPADITANNGCFTPGEVDMHTNARENESSAPPHIDVRWHEAASTDA